MKIHLATTGYGDFLENEPSPLHTTTIAEKCTLKMVEEFTYLRANAVNPLAQFLDCTNLSFPRAKSMPLVLQSLIVVLWTDIRYGYMIDNVVLLITGTLHERDPEELKEKCHPLGLFDSMVSITVQQNVSDLYNDVLIDTPLGPYIQSCLSQEDLNEMNIEIIRNTLFKAYLEDFYAYCMRLGGVTAEVMHDILMFEADRRSINITLNSFGTELTRDDRAKLYPTLGLLHPEGIERLKKCDDADQVKAAIDFYPPYRALLDDTQFNEDKTLEDSFFEREVDLHKHSFYRQGGYGAFYSFFKLKEQEIRNIVWIAECIMQDQKSKMNQYIPLFPN